MLAHWALGPSAVHGRQCGAPEAAEAPEAGTLPEAELAAAWPGAGPAELQAARAIAAQIAAAGMAMARSLCCLPSRRDDL
jgi:hypothetical protein